MRAILSALAILMASILAAEAECDPAVILQQNHLAYEHNTWTDLAYLDSLKQHNMNSEASSASVSIPQYGSLSGGDQQQYVSDIEKLLQINFNNEDRQWLLLSYLPDEAVQAYEDCLQHDNQNLYVKPTLGMLSEDFFVDIKLRPWIKSGQEFPVEIGNFINGSRVGSGKLKIEEGGSLTIHVRRHLDKYFGMSVTVGKETQKVVLPPQPMVIIQETRFATDPMDLYTGRDTNRDRNGNSCVSIANGDPAIIIPGTVQFTKTCDNSSSIIFNPVLDVPSTDIYACYHSTWNHRKNTWTGSVRGYASALVAVKVKYNATSSDYRPPAYVNDWKFLHSCP